VKIHPYLDAFYFSEDVKSFKLWKFSAKFFKNCMYGKQDFPALQELWDAVMRGTTIENMGTFFLCRAFSLSQHRWKWK